MPELTSWGVLSTAKIARVHVIPAIQKGRNCRVDAIASRNADSARKTADELGIARAYGDYQALLEDPDIQVIYNPLPNHMHKEWSIRAMKAGKHLLCEKPLALSVPDIRELIAVRNECGVQAGEAFMVDNHPQWHKVREIMDSGELGEILSFQSYFSYYNVDAANIRNNPEYGGGALWDIGCYPIHVSRMLLGREPDSVSAMIDRDPKFGTDRSTSGSMRFGDLLSTFTVSTQISNRQFFSISGSKATLEVEIPYNAPNDRECRILINRGNITRDSTEIISIPVCDQYTLEGENFSEAASGKREVPVSLEDSLYNNAIILAMFKSADERREVEPGEILQA